MHWIPSDIRWWMFQTAIGIIPSILKPTLVSYDSGFNLQKVIVEKSVELVQPPKKRSRVRFSLEKYVIFIILYKYIY